MLTLLCLLGFFVGGFGWLTGRHRKEPSLIEPRLRNYGVSDESSNLSAFTLEPPLTATIAMLNLTLASRLHLHGPPLPRLLRVRHLEPDAPPDRLRSMPALPRCPARPGHETMETYRRRRGEWDFGRRVMGDGEWMGDGGDVEGRCDHSEERVFGGHGAADQRPCRVGGGDYQRCQV